MVELPVFIVEIRRLIGAPPAGFEWLEYVIVAILLLWIVNACITFVSAILRWIGSGILGS